MDGLNEARNIIRWTSPPVYTIALLCLVLGIVMGYLLRGSASATRSAAPIQGTMLRSAAATRQITPEQLRHMADKQAEPLIAELKDDPDNSELMVKIAKVYFAAHQLPESMKYLKAALQVKPSDTELRTQLGRFYFSLGDPDNALAEFEKVLTYDPKNADALFNIGIVRFQAKADPAGAVSSWRRLISANPNHPKRRQVEQLISEAERQVQQ